MSSAGLPGCHRNRGAGLCSSSFKWFCKDWGQVWATIFTVPQPPAQILHELPGTVHVHQACAFNPPVMLRLVWYASSLLFASPLWSETYHWACSATQPLVEQCESSKDKQFKSANKPLGNLCESSSGERLKSALGRVVPQAARIQASGATQVPG